MHNISVLFAIAVVGISDAAVTAQELPEVVVSTSLGDIVVELDTVRAPISAGNFLRYVRRGIYDGGRFYRTVTPENQPDNDIRIEAIQGGISPDRRPQRLSPIPLERTSVTGLRHLNGVISVARAGVDTGSSEFFICIGDQPELDFGGRRHPDGQGFAAFGRVLSGMEVVREIQSQAADGQRIVKPVQILRMEAR